MMSHDELLKQERLEQARWRPLDSQRVTPIVERLLEAEFRERGLARDMENRNLSGLLTFARRHVPLYRADARWKAATFVPTRSHTELLAQLPIIGKAELGDSFDKLRADHTPRGYEGRQLVTSSGTTGRPTKVLFSLPAASMFGFYLQRQMRWERVDPHWTQAMIRLPRDLPRQSHGSVLGDGAIHRGDSWMQIGGLFKTGPTVAVGRANSVDFQLAWLRKEQPEYLVTFPGNLEALVYESQGSPVESLCALRSISATLTEGMRARIENATGLGVQQNYGLNEIGIVATRCTSGRYHVNSEHCVVEIVDAKGVACHPGETGRVLVTALTNLAMPLVRYDTRDLAEAVGGICSCGRTLPSFGRVIGRYRPLNAAPGGTSDRVDLVSDTIEKMPLRLLKGLREYQLHQYRDGSFELRMVLREGSHEELIGVLRTTWDDHFDETTPLRILPMDRLPPPPGGKQQDFSSDFFPDVNADPAPEGVERGLSPTPEH